MINDVCFVIRQSGERTFPLCRELVFFQIGAEHDQTVISEKPFYKTLIRGIEIAKESGKRWTIFLDADILLKSGVIKIMVDRLALETRPFYMMNFRVLDRSFNGPAYGVHAYPTSCFEKVEKFYALAEKDQRPETRLCKEMAKRGLPTILVSEVVGLHDFEQYYRDIYRKTFVRALKFGDHIDYMSSLYRQKYNQDDEYKIMLWGLFDGLAYRYAHNYAPLDVDFYRERAKETLDMLGLVERTPINPMDVPGWFDRIDQTIRNHQEDDEYLRNMEWIGPVSDQPQFYGFGGDRNLEDLRKRILKRTKRKIKAIWGILAND